MSIEEKFHAAVDVIESLPSDGTFQPSEDLILKLHAFYMQAIEGPCKNPKPSIWYYSSRIKWNAWNELGNMEKEVAMEKYVEELTKVIETMSYNENVSKFMSLIGPFYEVVAPEEIDQLSEKKSNTKSPTEYIYPVKNLEDFETLKMENSPKKSINMDFGFSSNRNSRSSKRHKYTTSVGSQKTKYIPQQCVIDMLKTKTKLRHQPFGSHQDILILTIINLQNSMEEIVQKLDNLQSLAKTANFNFGTNDPVKTPTDWNLGYRGTIFALLWPVAVHLCTKSL